MNASLSTDVPTAADIAVDNPPRDPQLVVKRGRPRGPRFYATTTEKTRAWKRANPERHREHCRRAREHAKQRHARHAAVCQRLQRVAAARGMTAEALLDEMERPDA